MELLLRTIYVACIILLTLSDWFSALFSFLSRLRKKVIQLVSFGATTMTSFAHWFSERMRKRREKRRRKRLAPSPMLTLGAKLRYFFLGAIFSFIFLFFPLAMALFLFDLPSPRELTTRYPNQTTKIYDRNGVLLYQMYTTQNRTLVLLEDVPKYLQYATLAIEDKNFYKHPGFDVTSIIRALRENVTGRGLQGGSTITQQLIKSSLLTPEPSIIRKTKEIALAFWAERLYTKNQILEMYFNQVPYGGTAWGVEAASEAYFGKKVKELTLAESAFLAGITAAPSTYSPYGEYPTLWKKRQKEVLNRMVLLGYITRKQANEALKQPLDFRSQQTAIYAPHFVAYIRGLLTRRYGLSMVERGGLRVVTSLDLKLYQMAQKVVSEEVAKEAYLNLTNGAALITSPKSGEVLAMVGSKDYTDRDGGNVNVTISDRQPGSAIKPITYSAALTHGMTAATVIQDTPITYAIAGSSPYSPVNYDGRYRGPVSLRSALANSLNIPAVKTLNQIGIPAMVNLGKDMGITRWENPSNYGLSVTLGAAEVTMLDMATVYGTLANGGIREDLNPILKITDYKGNVLEQKDGNKGRRVLREGIAFIITDILSDSKTRTAVFGTNSPLTIPGHTIAVKTGTTDNKRDNWTIGYTDTYVVTAWVGNNNNAPMSQFLASGITGAAPIWHRIMRSLVEKTPEKKPAIPDDVIQKPCLGKMEYFIKGTENSVPCGITPTPIRQLQLQRRSF
ncbi:MAG: penicillin-binding protein [Candidatus Levybacteria bacterium]|nr:penicillin-binding protein [Candidatus Levybacteria bacterium]